MQETISGSAKYALDGVDMTQVLKAVIYSAISSGISAGIVVISMPQIPPMRTLLTALLVPVINGVLVTLKKFFSDESYLVEKPGKTG